MPDGTVRLLNHGECQVRLQGKVAIVTGGGSGIGREIAEAFAREGSAVVVFGRREAMLQETVTNIVKAGGRAIAITGDVTSPGDVDALVARTVDAFGKVDVLANIAGLMYTASLSETTDKMFDEILDTNMKGTFLCCRRVLPEFERQGKGKIINMASIAGRIGISDNSAYSAAKAGIAGFTVALAKELGPKNINVNALGPGGTETDLNRHLLKDPAIRQQFIDECSIKRVADVKDIAPGAVFLASDESDFVTGITLFIDGGWTI